MKNYEYKIMLLEYVAWNKVAPLLTLTIEDLIDYSLRRVPKSLISVHSHF